MSQSPQRNSFFKIGAILLGLFASIFLLLSRRTKKALGTKGVGHHKVTTSPDAALKYWTDDKMRHARGVELPHVAAPDRGNSRSPRQA